jgi:hypothetical protein
MKLAVVCPPSDTLLLTQSHLGFHLAEVTQMVLSRQYADAYKRLGEQGYFIILDNGAAEEMEYDFQDTVDRAHYIRASEIVLPDRMGDSIWTLSHTVEVAGAVPPTKRMIVPQGTDEDEWFNCLYRIHGKLHGLYATIGVPKHFGTARPAMLERLSLEGWVNGHNIHLLGLSGKLGGVRTEIEALRQYHFVRSIDTGAPIAFAQHGVYIDIHRVHFSLEWDTPLSKMDRKLARENIKKLVEMCNE